MWSNFCHTFSEPYISTKSRSNGRRWNYSLSLNQCRHKPVTTNELHSDKGKSHQINFVCNNIFCTHAKHDKYYLLAVNDSDSRACWLKVHKLESICVTCSCMAHTDGDAAAVLVGGDKWWMCIFWLISHKGFDFNLLITGR